MIGKSNALIKSGNIKEILSFPASISSTPSSVAGLAYMRLVPQTGMTAYLPMITEPRKIDNFVIKNATNTNLYRVSMGSDNANAMIKALTENTNIMQLPNCRLYCHCSFVPDSLIIDGVPNTTMYMSSIYSTIDKTDEGIQISPYTTLATVSDTTGSGRIFINSIQLDMII